MHCTASKFRWSWLSNLTSMQKDNSRKAPCNCKDFIFPFTKTCFLFEKNMLCVVGQVEKWHQKYIKVHIGLEVHDHRIDLERHLHIFKSRLCEKYAFRKYIFGKYAF